MSHETQHTPGPWTHAWDSARIAYTIEPVGVRVPLAVVFKRVEQDETANARLIATAPNLLSLAERLLDIGCMVEKGKRAPACGDCWTCELAHEAILAVAAATGRTEIEVERSIVR